MSKTFISLTVISTAIAVSLVGRVSASSQRFVSNPLATVNKTTTGLESVTQSGNLIADNYVTSNKLTSGQGLTPGQYLISLSNNYKLILQYDGNLVLYNLKTGVPYWASNTIGRPVRNAIMQGDGNFVIYDIYSRPIWASNTAGNPGAYLKLKGDGELLIRNADKTFLKILAPAQEYPPPFDPCDPPVPGFNCQ